MNVNEKIRKAEMDMILTDVYWSMVHGVSDKKN